MNNIAIKKYFQFFFWSKDSEILVNFTDVPRRGLSPMDIFDDYSSKLLLEVGRRVF